MITINLDDNNNDTSKVDKDVFQCLFKEINDHLENSKNNINIEKINEFKNSIEKIKSETIDKKTNLVLVGDFNSGKTTCCNSLIASLVDNQFKPWSTYDDFLVSANTENTYFITVVESSDSNKFSLEHYVDNKLIKNITVRADDVEEIKTYLIDLDNKSTEKLKEIAEIEAKRIEDPNFKGKVPMTIVKVKIPGFSEKFRIIDIPGMTSSTLRDRFFNFLEEKCLVNIFLIIRSLVHTKVSDPDFVITTNNICSTYPNSLSLLILTKVDELIKEKKDRNLKKYQDNLKEFLTYFGEKCTSLKNYGTFIVSCKEALEDNEIYKNGIIKLKNNIKNLEHTFAEKQKMNSLITRLKHCFNEFNSSNTELNNIFDIDEVDEVRSASVISCCKLQDNIIKWINIELNTLKDFQMKYVIEIEQLNILFKQVDERILTGKYLRRNSYIEDQIRHLGKVFQSLIIDTTIKNFTLQSFELFLKELPPSLREKVKSFLVEKGFIKKEIDDNIELSLKSIIGAFAGIALAAGVRFVILGLFQEMAAVSAIAIIPVIGWVVGVILGLGCVALSLSDFIGVWSRLNCFDDIIKICYESIVNKKKEIIKEYADNYDKMFEKFIEILKTSKVDSKLNEELRKILNIYDHSQTEIVINTFKQDSNLKTSISTSLEILEVSNQDDLTKVKEFMKIVLDRLV